VISYAYIIYIYQFTDAASRESSQNTLIWIPLDIILTFNIALYQLYYNFEQNMSDAEEESSCDHATSSLEESNKTPLLPKSNAVKPSWKIKFKEKL